MLKRLSRALLGPFNPVAERAFPFSALLGSPDADADDGPEVPNSEKTRKLVICGGCGHEWATNRHSLGLPIKCPKCHETGVAEGEVACQNCGRVYLRKRTNCPRCKHRREQH